MKKTLVKLYCYFQIYGEHLSNKTAHLHSHHYHHHSGYALIYAGTLLFMNWTTDDGLANFVKLIYDQRQIKTFAQESRIVINTAYYYTLLSIFFYGAG